MVSICLIIIYVFIFLFGLIVGSFLNCVIYRLQVRRSFLIGRSICPQCKHKLSFLDLIPLFSFLALRGRCRYCRKPISLQYPLVELATGALFILIIFWHLSFGFALTFELWALLTLCFMLCVSCFMIVILAYDLKHLIIPDNVLCPAIAITLVYRFVEILFRYSSFEILLSDYLLSAVIAAGFFLVIYFLSRGRWIGLGDVKLAVLLGLVLGFPKILVGLFLSYLIGGIIGIGLIIAKKKGLKSEVPFAPFLIISTFITLFWGEQIINWYLGLIR